MGAVGKHDVILVLLIFSFCFVQGEDWPGYRGYLGDGVSSESIEHDPVQLWSKSIGTGLSSPVVSNGLVYVVGHAAGAKNKGIDTVYCFDADTGDEIWTYSYPSVSRIGTYPNAPADLETSGPRATPVVTSTSIYILSIGGHLFCLDAGTGAVNWYRNVIEHLEGSNRTNGFSASLLVDANNVYLDTGGSLTALDNANSAFVWANSGGGGTSGSVTPVFGTSPLILYGGDVLTGVDSADGSTLWIYGMGVELFCSPIVSGTQVIYSTSPENGTLTSLDISGGTPVLDWENTVVLSGRFPPVLTGGELYALDTTGTSTLGSDNSVSVLKCIDPATGASQWPSDPALGWCNMIAAANELVIVRETGEIIRADLSDAGYSVINNHTGLISSYCWNPPALADGRLYIRNDKGDLVCLSVAPCVTIEALDSQALETTDNGIFRISRVSSDISSDLTVNIVISGTEETLERDLNGGSISTTDVTIPGGSSYVDVTVTPLDDAGDTDTETVIITLQPGAGYTVGTDDSATVYILDSGVTPPSVTVNAINGWINENGHDSDTFQIIRTPSASWPLEIDFSLTASTALPSDYKLSGVTNSKVIIPASRAFVYVSLIPIDDNSADGNLTVNLAVSANASYYTLGVPDNADIVIADDEDPMVDTDSDNMDDDWEMCYWGNLNETGNTDYDSDGMINRDEYTYGTDPLNIDTDRDGDLDWDEVFEDSNPLVPTSFIIIDEFEAWCSAGGKTSGPGSLLILIAGALMFLLFKKIRRL